MPTLNECFEFCVDCRILIEGEEGNVLYTGDFRWEHFDIEHMHHLRSGESYVVTQIILLTTLSESTKKSFKMCLQFELFNILIISSFFCTQMDGLNSRALYQTK